MTVATIGFFDGVHRGHQCLIRQVRDEALRRGGRSLLITFDRHPRSVFAPDHAPRLLTSSDEKMQLLRATGVDAIFVLPFDRAMAAWTARDFMLRVLKAQLGVEVLVIGYDHRFGRRSPAALKPEAEEGFEAYRAYGREMGIEVVLAHELEGEHISSSVVRKALETGDVERAMQLLGRPYKWAGHVVHGHGVGRQLGFPTANLGALESMQMLPARGAYAVEVAFADVRTKHSQVLPGMVNIGCRPTLDNGTDTSIEVHLLDFQGDLYGQTLSLSFIARLREERRFASEAELVAQLRHDKEESVRRLGGVCKD